MWSAKKEHKIENNLNSEKRVCGCRHSHFFDRFRKPTKNTIGENTSWNRTREPPTHPGALGQWDPMK